LNLFRQLQPTRPQYIAGRLFLFVFFGWRGAMVPTPSRLFGFNVRSRTKEFGRRRLSPTAPDTTGHVTGEGWWGGQSHQNNAGHTAWFHQVANAA
jgi:hypothetical protein